MRVRILFRDYEISDINKQQLLYGVAVLISVLSVFLIIFMLSYYSEDPANAGFPSPTPGVFSALTAAEQQKARQQQVQGAQTQRPPAQPVPSSGPEKPSPKPSPSPSPSATFTPTPTPTSTPTPSLSPSPNASSTPEPPSNPPPDMSSIQVSNDDLTSESAKIKLTTSENATCTGKYWKNSEGEYPDQEGIVKLTTNHEILLSGLNATTKYYYKISCKDEQGSSKTSDSYYFTTKNP